MAARKQLWHPDEVRARIQASQLINRLTSHALSEDGPLMDQSQVNAAKILLGKAIPDLTAVEHSGTIARRDIANMRDDELIAILREGHSAGTAEPPAGENGHNSVH